MQAFIFPALVYLCGMAQVVMYWASYGLIEKLFIAGFYILLLILGLKVFTKKIKNKISKNTVKG